MTLGRLFGALCAACCLATTLGQYNCNAFANSTKSMEFVTRQGTVPQGTPCCFPFVFKGQVYYECTNREHNQAWCAVESVYQENNKLWGNCQRVPTPEPTTSTTVSTTLQSGGSATGVTGPASGGVCYTTAVADTNSLGGTLNSATTVLACQNACSAATSCVGLDFDSNLNPGRCYLHNDATRFASKRQASGVSQYAKQPCSSTRSAVTPTTGSRGTPGSCSTTYTFARNTISYGGIDVPAPNDTPLECQAYCTAEPNCVGFDLDSNKNPNVCYWHRENSFGNRGANIPASQGIDQYAKVEQCDTTTTKTTLTTSGSCADSYTTVPNTGSFQGQLLGTSVTTDECIRLCNSRPFVSCQAFDYDFTQRSCYFHTATYETRLNTPANGLTQYRRNNICSGGGAGGSSTSATGTQSGGCQDTFTAFNSTFSYDGLQQPISVNSVDACATACRANQLCNAFDFNSLSVCYLHTNPNYLDSPGSGTGVSQFRRNRICGGGSGCVDSFEEIRDTLSYNGKVATGVNNVVRCRAACLTDNACDAFDFNTLDNSCFIHGTGFLQSVGTLTGINQYRRIRNCSSSTTTTGSPSGSTPTTTQSTTSGTTVNTPCPIVYETVSNTNYFGGQIQTGVSTENGCRALCTNSRVCVGFDFNTNNNQCFLHSASTYTQANRNQLNGVTTFRKLPCDATSASTSRDPSGCVDSFRVFRNTLAYDGIVANNVNTASDCEDRCRGSSSCVAFDFDNNDKMCYIHNRLQDLSVRNNNAQGVDLFVRVPCSGGGPDGTTTTQASGGSTPCQDSFNVIARAHAFNGAEVTGASTVDACRAACLGNSSCVAFDFNARSMCYVHIGPNNIRSDNVVMGVDGVTHYRRVFSCGGAPTTPPRIPGTCQDTFTVQTGTIYYGGTGTEVSPLNEGTCRAACLRDSTCLGFDLDPAAGCFIHKNAANFLARGNEPTINHYRRVPCNGTAGGGTSAASAAPGPGVATPTTPNAGGCVITYIPIANTLSFGGADQRAPQAVAECQEICTRDTTCVEFDFDTNPEASIRCFIHNTERARSPTMRVTKYVKQQTGCGTTASGGGNTPEPGCRMDTLPNQNGAGGVPTAAQTQEACRDQCLRERTCFAADWNRVENRCYRHEVIAGVTNNAACCTRFVKNCAVCQDRYERRAEKKIVGGTEQDTSINRETLCARTCSSQSSCTGFDFDRAKERCYLFFRPLSDSDVLDARGVDNYVLRKCSDAVSTTTQRVTTTRQAPTPTTECQDTFTITRNQQVLGGDEQQNTMTVLACEGLCRANQQCQGYDFNRQTNVCYLLTFDYQSNFVANRDVDNYRRRRCDGGSGGTPAPGGGTPRPGTPAPPAGACTADILFLVDSSGSIQDTGQNNYQLMQQFVSMLTDRLDIGSDRVRVALAIFSTNAELLWNYERYNTKQQLNQAINNIRYIGGETFTSRAFNIYLDQLRSGNGGNRPGVRDVIILITDGNTTSVDRSVLASSLTNVKREAEVLGVGIGSIDINEMMMIVTPPFTQNYVNVQDFTGLVNVLDNVILGTGCTSSGGGGGNNPPPGPPSRDQCLADVVFVIDESGSIRDSNVAGQRDNYDLLKDFTVGVISQLRANVDNRNINIGAIRFSDTARVEFDLNDYFGFDAITRQIQGFPFTGGNTNTTGGLRAARTLILNTNGDRDNARYPNKIVLITDGYATREQAILEVEANTVKSQGTVIIGVGVTRNINVQNLERVTSGSRNIFTANDFMTLNSITSNVASAICPTS